MGVGMGGDLLLVLAFEEARKVLALDAPHASLPQLQAKQVRGRTTGAHRAARGGGSGTGD
jgi:hypothetical protein